MGLAYELKKTSVLGEITTHIKEHFMFEQLNLLWFCLSKISWLQKELMLGLT